MATRSWIAATLALALLPLSANALSVTIVEGGVSTGLSEAERVVAVGRDQVGAGDLATEFPTLPGVADALGAVEGSLAFSFSDENFLITVFATQSVENGVFTSAIQGVVTGLGPAGTDLPLLSLYQTAPDFITEFDQLSFTTTLEEATFGDGGLALLASFYAASNAGNNPALGEDNFLSSSLDPSVDTTIASKIVSNGDADFAGGQTLSVIADENFAINHALIFALEGGDSVTFTLVTTAVVPLPAPMMLLMGALAAIGAVGIRKRMT
ncbi:MAG: hypothetical protein AAGE80_11970 [Pseudomonadota bacterium]